jgi:hypothetical protein
VSIRPDPEPERDPDAPWSEVIDRLVVLLHDVVEVQRELVEAVDQLQKERAEEPETEWEGGRTRETSAGLRAQALQYRRHARRLIEQASELSARSRSLQLESAGLVNGGVTATSGEEISPPA